MNIDGPSLEVLTTSSELQTCHIVVQDVFVVVIDLSKEISLRAAEWCLDKQAQTGDTLILLGVLEDTGRRLLKSRLWLLKDDSNTLKETNEKVVPDEAMRKKSEIEEHTRDFQLICNQKGVLFEIRVRVGSVKSVVVEEATALHAMSLTFDRNLKLQKKKYKFIQERVTCQIFHMKNDYEADMIHEGDLHLDTNSVRASSSDESQDEATSMSLDCEFECFSLNLNDPSPQPVSSVSMSTDETQSDWQVVEEDFQQKQQTDTQKGHGHKPTETQSQLITSLPVQSTVALNWSVPSMNFSQGRSFLCSGCNQKSPEFLSLSKRFRYMDLETATSKFSPVNFLAEGGFGSVYKGTINGQMVAVKQHKLASTQGYKEFRAEVDFLSCAQHRNLVMLLGYCDENGHQMLVYEYVCNKSLDWHLSSRNEGILPWAARQRIAVGAARALRYLHEECRVGCIIHRDMRPNNILLTHDFEPLVGDFGLARSHPEGDHAIETRIIGTFGYLAPEYAESGQVSWKSDVYAFGVVLLELITGRKAIDLSRQPGQQILTEWARPRLLDEAMLPELVDVRLGESFNFGQVRSMMRAADLCIRKDPSARRRMSQVLHILEGENIYVDETPRQSMDLIYAAAAKTFEFHSSHNHLVPSLPHVASQKSQSQKVQPGNNNSRKPKLSYTTML